MPDEVLPLRELELMDEDARRQLKDRRAYWWRTGASARPRTCDADGTELRWALTEEPHRAVWMPLNPAPIPSGTVGIYRDGGARIARVNPPPDFPGGRWQPHFATCADPDRYRQPRT